MQRGEIWWADLPAPVGSRPVIILTRDAVVNSIGSVVVAIVTRTVRGLSSEVRLNKAEGLPVPSVANFDNILTVPRARFVRRMGMCSRERTAEIDAAVMFALGLS
jgi:mRNA interferase MazF